MSLPEVLLWRELKKRPSGLKFRRQHPYGHYILDFYCDIAKLVRQLAEANRPHLANKPVEIFVEGLEGIIIEAPEAVLSVAIGNLLGNACKYTVEGEVRCRVEADHIAIEDTGPGLSTEDAERLFERGYRGSSVGNTTGGGIGLSIVRRLCELYGWKVSIAPREQGGAVAILRFS